MRTQRIARSNFGLVRWARPSTRSDQDWERRPAFLERTSDAAFAVTVQGEPRWNRPFSRRSYRDLESIGSRIRDICAVYFRERGKFVRVHSVFAHDVLNGDAAGPPRRMNALASDGVSSPNRVAHPPAVAATAAGTGGGHRRGEAGIMESDAASASGPLPLSKENGQIRLDRFTSGRTPKPAGPRSR